MMLSAASCRLRSKVHPNLKNGAITGPVGGGDSDLLRDTFNLSRMKNAQSDRERTKFLKRTTKVLSQKNDCQTDDLIARISC